MPQLVQEIVAVEHTRAVHLIEPPYSIVGQILLISPLGIDVDLPPPFKNSIICMEYG